MPRPDEGVSDDVSSRVLRVRSLVSSKSFNVSFDRINNEERGLD